MKIDELIKTLSEAVREAHKTMADNSMREFFRTYFEAPAENSENGAYTPKTIGIVIPNGLGEKGKGKVICAPTAALVTYNDLVLDEVRINLDIALSEDMEEVNPMVNGGKDVNRTGSIQILFKAADESEGVARVRTHLNGMI